MDKKKKKKVESNYIETKRTCVLFVPGKELNKNKANGNISPNSTGLGSQKFLRAFAALLSVPLNFRI